MATPAMMCRSFIIVLFESFLLDLVIKNKIDKNNSLIYHSESVKIHLKCYFYFVENFISRVSIKNIT